MKKKRMTCFSGALSLLGGSVNFGVSTSTQDQVVSSYDASPSSTFNH